jgi:hypothetical protein
MLKEKRTGHSLNWEHFENKIVIRPLWKFRGQILRWRFFKDIFREALMIFQNFRLPEVITTLILGLFFANSATAGYWKIICKDGYQAASVDGCKNHKGLQSKTLNSSMQRILSDTILLCQQ